ncbi:MAG TPA: sigma-70 family RNA polymerase sigma factor [Kofleriaceae bacterium]|nr:sigma-70 family RNA polymerase sigma factor [Kofleriaceae bacterium]
MATNEADADPAPDADAAAHPAPDVVQAFVDNHRELLAFVQRRVGDRALAEDILQDALVRGLDRAGAIEDSAIGWLYRVLRNAIIDHHRRQAAAARRLDALAAEPPPAAAATAAAAPDDPALHATVCRCVTRLADTLKPEYAAALRRIDVAGVPVKDYAAEAGISASNAGVRVFRAREALRRQVARSCGTCAEHGCLDCTCGQPAPPARPAP